MTVQSIPDTSPTKWHLAHTRWFFETFVVRAAQRNQPLFHPEYSYLFNSYYQSVGAMHPRPRHGMLARPTIEVVLEYRHRVDETMALLLVAPPGPELAAVMELGLNHEQQHQKLMITDGLHLFAQNPLRPAFPPDTTGAAPQPGDSPPCRWVGFEGGHHRIGHAGDGFAFDCEGPCHEVLLRPFALAARPVTNGEWMSFTEDGALWRAVQEAGEDWGYDNAVWPDP